jgi:hypothetical protein
MWSLNRERIYFDLRSISPKIANILDTLVLVNGMLNPEELTKLLALEASSLGEPELVKFLEALRQSGKFDDALKNIMEYMRRLTSAMEKEREI